MSFSATTKHPKKKRRIDGITDPLPGPSAEALPLVAPHLFRKSSKDPNRGMYPRGKDKFLQQKDSSCPQFVKASDLCKKSLQAVEEKKSKSSEDYSSTKYAQKNTSDSEETNFKSDCNSAARQQFYSHGMKGKRTRRNFTHTGATNKITKYFESSPNSSKRHKVNTVKTRNTFSETPSTAWAKKDENIQQLLTNNERFFKTFSDCYGLLENTVKEDGEDFFNKLPNHIIENILCQIPILDLMACRLVCTRWNEIIDAEKFMEWKKMYYRYKKGCPDQDSTLEQDQIYEIIQSFDHKAVEDSITILISYMGKRFNRRPSPDMYDLLVKNSKGELADQVLSERYPEWNGKETRVWCQFTLAILICETVWDVYSIYMSLFVKNSACSRHDVIDSMYCIATFLLYYRNTDNINFGLHYRVYYALHLIENHVPTYLREKQKIIKGLPGQQSIHTYSTSESTYLTYEQMRILNHQFELNQKVRIIALAGTGKTTTLLHLARLYPQIKFLNLVFNKALSEEAKRKFPSNVTCQTAHSLAYGATGRFLRHKLSTSLTAFELQGQLKHNEGNMQIYAYANLVISTIVAFTTSATTELSLIHVPYLDSNSKKISDSIRDRILKDAHQIWQKMISKDDMTIKATHDTYLKLYQLQKPKFHKYQCIMVDEAQDCNPVIMDIVISQNVPIILVGDPNQQIYGFRGAHNALKCIKATHTYYLTKSFRFGPEISYVASIVLELLLNSRSNTIIGSTHDSFINGKTVGQYAVISRTNVQIFNEAIRMIVFKDLKKHEPTSINAAFAGGIRSYGFDQILDIYKLSRGSQREHAIKDKLIAKFKSLSDLIAYAKYSNNSDLRGKIDLVNQHGSNIFKYISVLYDRCSHPIELANVVFSTAHKAKGLEFDTVRLAEDFPFTSPLDYYDNVSPAHEEINVLYVALTRAKKSLLLPDKMTKVLLVAHEKFEYPVSSKFALSGKTELKCVQCEGTFIPHTVLLLIRRGTILGTGREIAEGYLCMKCGSDLYMRPDVHINGIIMYLDPTKDNCHRFMLPIVGPLPTDPPIIHDRFAQFENADRVFVINLNIH